jgi:glycosyltransferase involved in cell wall biosynthesis
MMPPLHLITCEYPPAVGGVSDHSRVLSDAATAAGHEVHIWTGSIGASSTSTRVHADLDDFSARALTRADAALDAWPMPRRVIVQWVPHGYGRKGVNVAFSRWIRRRARAGDRIDLIVHEPFMDFFGPSWRQPIVALMQRYMTWTAVRAAERVWLTIPAWEPRVRLARRFHQQPLRHLPVPGTIPPACDAPAVAALRATLLKGRSRLVGYFGTGGRYASDAVKGTIADLAMSSADAAFVCIGRNSEGLAADLRAAAPGFPIAATGVVELDRLSLHLQACDALVQPYSDGVSGRRTTTVSALEHGLPVATTAGALSETFWTQTRAVETVPAAAPTMLPAALRRLLDPSRNATARTAALALYRERFDPARTFPALFETDLMSPAVGLPSATACCDGVPLRADSQGSGARPDACQP